MAAHAECLLPDLPEWVLACLFDLDGASSPPFGPHDVEQYLDGKFLAGAVVVVDDVGELVHGL
jgi:hypothetical protein